MYDVDDPEVDEEIGEFDGYWMKHHSNVKDNEQFYHELKEFANKAVAYFNANKAAAYFNEKNNKNLCFHEIEEVTSCCCCGKNYSLIIIATDPVDNPIILEGSGILRCGTEEAHVEDCKLLTLRALPQLFAKSLAARYSLWTTLLFLTNETQIFYILAGLDTYEIVDKLWYH